MSACLKNSHRSCAQKARQHQFVGSQILDIGWDSKPCAPTWEIRTVYWGACGALLLHPLSSPLPSCHCHAEARLNQSQMLAEKKRERIWKPIREQFSASYRPGLVCRSQFTHTHRYPVHTLFFMEGINTQTFRVSIYSSVQVIWSEQVAACKLKCEAPVFPSCPVLHDWFSTSLSPQIFGSTIMGFGLWILLDNQSFIAVLRKPLYLHKMRAT